MLRRQSTVSDVDLSTAWPSSTGSGGTETAASASGDFSTEHQRLAQPWILVTRLLSNVIYPAGQFGLDGPVIRLLSPDSGSSPCTRSELEWRRHQRVEGQLASLRWHAEPLRAPLQTFASLASAGPGSYSVCVDVLAYRCMAGRVKVDEVDCPQAPPTPPTCTLSLPHRWLMTSKAHSTLLGWSQLLLTIERCDGGTPALEHMIRLLREYLFQACACTRKKQDGEHWRGTELNTTEQIYISRGFCGVNGRNPAG